MTFQISAYVVTIMYHTEYKIHNTESSLSMNNMEMCLTIAKNKQQQNKQTKNKQNKNKQKTQ